MSVEVGTWDGNSFVSHGACEFLGQGENDTASYEYSDNISVEGFGLSQGHRIAMRITGSETHIFNIVVGAGQSFLQSPSYVDPTAPAAATGSAVDLTTTAATLQVSLDSTGTEAEATVYLEWGTSPEYGNRVDVGQMQTGGDVTLNLPDLAPNTTYYYRFVAVGNGISYGVGGSFTTPA